MSKPNPIKRVIKRSLQHAAAKFGRHTRSSKEPQLLVLTYHRILPVNDKRTRIEEPGMVVTPESFELHMRLITQLFEVVRISEWISRRNADLALPAHACAVTFDDGWADNYEYAFPILQQHQVPATIYLVSDLIGTDRLFWPERLARTMSNIAQYHAQEWVNPALDWIRVARTSYQFGALPPNREELSELIADAKALSDSEIHARLDGIENTLGLDVKHQRPSLLKWEQMAEMIASGLIEPGSHTCHHVRMGDETELSVMKKEIISSKRLIEQQTGQSADTFCFPNGDYSPLALDLVRQHYKGALTSESGWNSVATDNHLLRRIGIHEDISSDSTAFLARISGWL